MNPIMEAQRLGQEMWLDYIRRDLLKSGELKRLIELGISGLTANPAIIEKAIVGSTDYDEELLDLARSGKSAPEIYERLAIEDIQASADLLRPIYEKTGGERGYACLEISPLLAYDTVKTIEESRRLFAALGRPNVMVKVPATPEGIPAIRRLVSEGINVNVTLIFSLDSYHQVMEAYIAGLEELVRNGGDPREVASVASFFLSRIDTAVDKLLEERMHRDEKKPGPLPGKAAIASAKLAYKAFKGGFYGRSFEALKLKGARVQRPLWASTGTKNPAYSDVMYVEPLIGPDTVNTMPPATIDAFMGHGRVEATLEYDVSEAEETMAALVGAGIDMDLITAKLLADGVESFAGSYKKLLAGIEEKGAWLLAPEHVHPGINTGTYLGDLEAAVVDLSRRDIMGRIWRRDHTVWKPQAAEITNRLGWLNITDLMHDRVTDLKSFADEVRDAGFFKMVLLGMGGSSLGAAVLGQVFCRSEDYPELIVLDSTVPARVQAVTGAIEPGRTLFLVSSKSGTTAEPLALWAYFRRLVEVAVGKGKAGQNFVAITDPGTPLASLAEKEGFRRAFLNPLDIGGRYSVLSYFGLVPAALTGVDLETILDRADFMRERCTASAPVHDNPGAWLGAYSGSLALRGRDKLSLLASPSVSSLALWVEQLVAESTGKEGKGVIPVVDEPLFEPSCYGDDRAFVYLRLEGDDNYGMDAVVERIKASGQPVLVLEMKDRYDLGAEFFRWEFATAVLGSMLGVNPFDQPNVQQAKEATERLLKEYSAAGRLPQAETGGSLRELLGKAGKGKYFAVTAYIHQTAEADRALADLRRKVTERYGMATTLGYGPRYLHSTGQLHKGGPNTGLFLQLTASYGADIPVPDRPYTFGVVAEAQALGDLQALKSSGRQVVRVHLDGDVGMAIPDWRSGVRGGS